MRKTISIMMVAAIAGCTGGQRHTDTSTAGLQAANAGYSRALIDGDAAALANYYTDDFTIIDDDANIHGKANQIRTMTQVVDLLEARSDDVRITPLGPDAALLTGRVTGRYRLGGKENAFTERYTSVWVRDGNDWRVKHEHASLTPSASERRAE